jgi:hypothetical protein
MAVQQELPPESMSDEIDYMELIIGLEDYRKRLGITDKPDSTVQVTFTTGLPGRHIGAVLPVYSPEKCGTDGYSYMLYNLMALTGFEAPESFNPRF